ncbi:MAG: fatty acid desaturase [Rhodobacteraceae bacterium]|nr:fatty acid desaturase [Paracoccaceae bacterium]
MIPESGLTPANLNATPTSREWVQILARYRDPSSGRSLFELAVTVGPFILLWGVAWWALSISYWLALAIAVLNGIFLVRIFAIQHDCGHRAFFKSKLAGDWLGRILGGLTLTPYDVWQRTHAVHHSAAGNLDKRGMGDVHTLTVAEYRALSGWGRFVYRLYRNPLVLFGLGPIYLFYLQNRLPVGLMRSGMRFWTSAMITNAFIAAIIVGLIYFGGWMTVTLIFIPTTLVGASIGIWLFYVQHQFETTQWDKDDDWQLHDAALNGSSHYELPKVLQWLTANIGVHHVHHLYSRIPFYRLTEVLRDHPVLANTQRLTLWQSFRCVRLQLWDEEQRKLLTHAQAQRIYGPISN